MKQKQIKHKKGGKRIGSGRKKADYETKTIAFRVRGEFVERVKKLVKDAISEWVIKYRLTNITCSGYLYICLEKQHTWQKN